jgi:hypothetical protein
MKLEEMTSQREELEKVASLIRSGCVNIDIMKAAKALKNGCDDRDDMCELEALYDAVKNGTDRVDWLRHGVRYVADPQPFDSLHSVRSIIEFCREGANAFDCDDQTILMGSLAASLGFKVGARAWGPGRSGDYGHVYAVAGVPKSGPWPRDYYGHGLDTTVPSASVGWEPSGGHILTSWLK